MVESPMLGKDWWVLSLKMSGSLFLGVCGQSQVPSLIEFLKAFCVCDQPPVLPLDVDSRGLYVVRRRASANPI